MLKIALSGCSGRMGHVIADIVSQREDIQIVAGFDINTAKYADFPIFSDPFEFQGKCDVMIDFSNVACTEQLLRYCEKHHTPIVLCTTGHSPAQLQRIREASAAVPVFRSGNMSLGINLMSDLLGKCAAVLGERYDVEVIEKHHNQKLDAPSGTALMLADAVAAALPYQPAYVYDRHTRREKRPAHEIGISTIRGGTIVGEHSVLFCGRDEIIEIKHTALSREVFAVGAVDAAVFMAGCTQPGMYDMNDVIAARGV
ncbi:MAG: 4-hydroxy-tetrahydrodipicolinate reductase [Agathobaculum sp.]|uniref:4-hydroxy-tetrahydrodipicolinate reductase n=1 Tax=Agathobaculum sp. TaxID=2048138 RepID=UPI0025BB2C91|nr:4-hydroxy-tetrahydrodipicolinate reductase [Agathobaculum sp.]MCI7125183.1 4-hydroxy-tetrahydrodipicolinate reductase [Agathobaculum sp.]MDY3712700.1 4-hydroxy-tetrahydrodipicolinate reductase [Agathobaculum sp.]